MDQNYAPANFRYGVVAASLTCRQCGYELRGLKAGGVCPECGLSVWASVLHAGDPEGARLPRLSNPKAVGAGLLWLVLTWTLASMLWVSKMSLSWLDSVDPLGGKTFSHWTPPYPRHIAGVLVLTSLWSVWRLWAPKRANETVVVRRDFRLLLIGIIFGGLAMLELAFMSLFQARFTTQWYAIYQLAIQLALIVFIVVGMAGLQGILRVVGQRSREYRTAKEGRQNVHAMMAVLVFMGIGLALSDGPRIFSSRDGFWPNVGTVILAISYLMFVIGMVYLFVNTLWIRKTLRHQPATLDELLVPSLPDDTEFGKTPETSIRGGEIVDEPDSSDQPDNSRLPG